MADHPALELRPPYQRRDAETARDDRPDDVVCDAGDEVDAATDAVKRAAPTVVPPREGLGTPKPRRTFDAILAHGGQGKAARDRFAARGDGDRANLIAFLNSL